MFKLIILKRFLCAATLALTMLATAADKPADAEFKALLEKYAAAYSAMDAKALEPLDYI